MKKLVLSGFLLLFLLTARAQYGNEWVDFDKTYFKIAVSEDGLYRVSASLLGQNGLNSVVGSNIRLYRMGEEVAVYVTTSGAFGSNDFIEFVGKKNRGEFDRKLYADPDAQHLNPEVSMFTDTMIYFLTTSDTGTGMRIQPSENDLTNAPDPEPYYMHEDIYLFADEFFDPRIQVSVNVTYSHFNEGEGLSSSAARRKVVNILSNNFISDGPSAELKAHFVSDNFVVHDVFVTLGPDTLFTQVHEDVRLMKVDAEIESESIKASNKLAFDDKMSASGILRLAFASWRYAREFVFSGDSAIAFKHAASSERQLFELTGLEQGQGTPLIFDLTNNVRVSGVFEGEVLRAVLEPSDTDRELLFIASERAVHYVEDMARTEFRDWRADNPEYVIITHPAFRSGSDAVGEYMSYRQSDIGGSFDVKAYNVLDIYDQFGFGIPRHSQSLRNFAFFMRNTWPNIKLIYIIGKGLDYDLSRECDEECRKYYFVPTFGAPGADNLLFAAPFDRLPIVPVGRLPVINQEEILLYLKKVKEYDLVMATQDRSVQNLGWTKNVLHLAGGNKADLQASIKSYLDRMGGSIIESEKGASLVTFSKQSTNVAGNPDVEEILEILKDGTGIVTFFGHSSSKLLDYNVNNPTAWKNVGKYPIFNAMGCSAGQIHKDERSLAEEFVFEPDAGTIAFVSGSGTQYLNPLGSWGRRYYSWVGDGEENIDLGSSIIESLRPISQSSTLINRVLVEQQTITGDPALKYHASSGRDYTWDFSSARFTPNVITVNDEEYTLNVNLTNLGRNEPDSIAVLIEQKTPEGDIIVLFNDTVYIDRFQTELSFRLPVLPDAPGLNVLYLTVDPDNVIEESPAPYAEENNSIQDNNGKKGLEVFFLDDRILASSPKEFEIVTTEKFTLVAGSADAFSGTHVVVFELDTTATFDSPLLERYATEQTGNISHWRPDIALNPNKVYYWRVSIDSLSAEKGFTWDYSSFLYLPGSDEGWNQSHYYQFLKDAFNQLELDTNRHLNLTGYSKNIWIQNAIQPTEEETFRFFIDGTLFTNFFSYWQNVQAHVFVAVFDSVTSKTLKNPPGGKYGAVNPFSIQRPVFPFRTDIPEGRLALMNFLQDTIPQGQYVALYTYQRLAYMDYYPEDWESDSLIYGKNIFSVIEDQYPSSKVRSLKSRGSVPYTLLYRKGGKTIAEEIAPNAEATVDAEFDIKLRSTEGYIRSKLIGPATSWDRIIWKNLVPDSTSADSALIKYIAYSVDGNDSIVGNFSTDSAFSIAGIEASNFPYLLVETKLKDEVERTPPQLTQWQVFYSGSPDYLFNSSESFFFEKDTLQDGQKMKFATTVQNIGSPGVDSFEVEFTIASPSNEEQSTFVKLPALKAGEIYPIDFESNISGVKGEYTFLVHINPVRDIIEKDYTNNTGILNFYVSKDELNPVMDVNFDGRHLAQDDLVSKNPVIEILLMDDSDLKPLNDVEDFELFLQRPSGFDFESIDILSAEIEFFPAATEDLSSSNLARLVFKPTLDEEGFYIFKVRARDASGNYSGELYYQIQFQVDDRRGITYAQVYPNPMSSSTQFDFLLYGTSTGSELGIEIFDLTGKLIHHIQADPYVGSHSVNWDGTNSTGNHLAPGTYYYRITAKDADGKNLPVTYPNGSKGVKAGKHVGKIVVAQ